MLVLAVAAGGVVFCHWNDKAKSRRRKLVSDRSFQPVSPLGRIRPLNDIVEVGVDAEPPAGKTVSEEGQSIKRRRPAYLEDYEELKAAAEQAASRFQGGQRSWPHASIARWLISPAPKRT